MRYRHIWDCEKSDSSEKTIVLKNIYQQFIFILNLFVFLQREF